MNSEGKIIADEDLAEVAPSPAPQPGFGLPGHLQDLTDRARGFLQSAQTTALSQWHQQFTPEHVLKVLLDDD